MLGFIAIEDLNLVTILEIHPAVPAGLHDQKLNVQSEIAIHFLRDDVSGTVSATICRTIVGHDHRAWIYGIVYDFPFDGQRRLKAWACPIRPLCVEHLTRAVHEDLYVGGRFRTDADIWFGRVHAQRGQEHGQGHGYGQQACQIFHRTFASERLRLGRFRRIIETLPQQGTEDRRSIGASQSVGSLIFLHLLCLFGQSSAAYLDRCPVAASGKRCVGHA